MMADQSCNPKWEGKALVELPTTSAEQVWPLLEDFCSFHKLIPLDTCYQVEGVPGQPGLVRYCANTTTADAEHEATVMWAKEKLLMIDPIQRCLTYEILDNNVGFNSYVATMKVLPIINREGDHKPAGSQIEWSFVSDPVQGWKFEDLLAYLEHCLQFMAKKMEQSESAADSTVSQ